MKELRGLIQSTLVFGVASFLCFGQAYGQPLATPVKDAKPAPHKGQERMITLFEDESTSLDAAGVKKIIVTNSQIVHIDKKFVTVGSGKEAPRYFIITGLKAGASEIVKIMETGELVKYGVKVMKQPTLDVVNVEEINGQLKRLFPYSNVKVRAEVVTLGSASGAVRDAEEVVAETRTTEWKNVGRELVATTQVETKPRAAEGEKGAAPSAQAGEAENVVLFLEGTVSNNYELDGMLIYLKGITKNVVNLARPESYRQVKLAAKIVELNRTKLKDMGMNFLGIGNDLSVGVFTRNTLNSVSLGRGTFTGTASIPIQRAFQILAGSGDFSGILSILEENQVAKTLSYPSIIVEDGGMLYDPNKPGFKKLYDDEPGLSSGSELGTKGPRKWADKSAELFVGGEIPVPVPQTGTSSITIEWKKFGITLNFLPRVMPDGRIKMKVWAESGDLNDTRGVSILGTQVPAVDRRYVETEVTLSENEDFAIGGLMYSKDQRLVSKIPLLGDIPVIGTFFKNVQNSNDERELVVVIKPSFVSPGKENMPPLDDSRVEFKWGDYILNKF